MKIKIINKFAYVESNDIDAIEVDDKILLEDIAETKCFDVEKNCVIDYDNSRDLKKAEILELRRKRENECFPIINRGELWYSTLSDAQYDELQQWYYDWLDVTKTLIEPVKPEWLK